MAGDEATRNLGFANGVGFVIALMERRKMNRHLLFWKAAPATQPWRTPVTILIGQKFWTIWDGRKAAKFLTSNWPETARQGPTYLAALKACLAELQGKGSPETVRQALCNAASAAKLDIMDGSPLRV